MNTFRKYNKNSQYLRASFIEGVQLNVKFKFISKETKDK